MSCPICNSLNISILFDRKNVPVHQNLVYPNKLLSTMAKKGDLTITLCKECGFIFNSSFDLSKLDYGGDYDNTQDTSPNFTSYLDELSKNLLIQKKIKKNIIVEIGCGKGTFLKKLVDNKYENIGIGFDPSYVGDLELLDGRLKFYKTFYDKNSSKINADIIICRHVIEHISEPVKLLKQIRNSLNSPNARVFFETPTVNWILQNQVIYDFFYEHCSYFSPSSLKTAFQISGFEVKNIDLIFGGQYIWLEAAIPSSKEIKIIKNPTKTIELANKFSSIENDLKTKYHERIKILSTHGKIAVWGAGAKGVTFVNLMDKKHKYIDSIIDLNPNKSGKFLPGTGHPIISYDQIQDRGIKYIFLMNPNYYEENLQLLTNKKINVNLIHG